MSNRIRSLECLLFNIKIIMFQTDSAQKRFFILHTKSENVEM